MKKSEYIIAHLPPYESKDLSLGLRIKILRKTVSDLESLTPTMGGKWREGMLRYYRSVLAELESYGSDSHSDKVAAGRAAGKVRRDGIRSSQSPK